MASINTAQRAGVILAVRDVERSLAFYTTQLGFSVQATFEDPAYAILSLGAMRLSLAEEGHEAGDLPGILLRAPGEQQGVTPQAMLVIEVPDVKAAYQVLLDGGVRFASEPYSPPWGGGRCFALDPDGWLIEIEELAA